MLSKTIPNVETPFTHFLTLQETLFDLANMLIFEGFFLLCLHDLFLQNVVKYF